MSRSKTISDATLLDRLLEAIRAHGPADLSFAKASAFAGLSAATLVQRFGDRAAMIEAILLRAWDQLDEATAQADAASGPGADGAIDLLMRLTAAGDADYDTTDGLLLLREDMRNPALRARGAAWGACLANAIGRRLSPSPDDGARLGRQAINVWQGAMLWWAFRRDARPEDAVRAALEEWRATAGF
jgi:AcrR family transcriptional regulator